MALEPLPPNDWAPIVTSTKYRLGNADTGGQWVTIVSIFNGKVLVRGIDGHQFEQWIPIWKFDDLVSDKMD